MSWVRPIGLADRLAPISEYEFDSDGIFGDQLVEQAWLVTTVDSFSTTLISIELRLPPLACNLKATATAHCGFNQLQLRSALLKAQMPRCNIRPSSVDKF
jgi:hypothetical protein